MKYKKKYITIIILFVFFFSSLQTVQGSQISWGKGDKYTWVMYSGYGSHYENETTTWDDYYFTLNHRLETKILKINSKEKEVILQESWYFTPSSDEPFTVQEVEKSYDLIGGLAGKDISNLFLISYEFDNEKNETYLNYVNINTGEDQFPLRYFCIADWSITNSLMQVIFDNSTIVDTVNESDFTFQNFLDNCSYSIMGVNDYASGINKMIPTNHHWVAKFDYSDSLEIRDPEGTSYIIEEANATFELKDSEGGVLEEFYLYNSIDIQIDNNYTYHQFNARIYTLIENNPANLLIKIVPAVVASVLLAVIITLIVKNLKKKKI